MPHKAKPINLLVENRFFFIPYLLFFLACVSYLFTYNQGDLILFFSEHRTVFGDFFFKYATKIGEEPTYVLVTLALLFVSFRKSLLIPIVGFTVMLVANLMKTYFAHQRPWAWFKDNGGLEDLNFVEGLSIYKGLSSFPSGHTMSAFALFCLLALLTKSKKWGLFFIALAILVGLSRVYLTQHFVKDICLGSFVGILLALIIYTLQSSISFNPAKWYDKKVKF